MFWASAFGGPALVEEPAFGEIGVVFPYGLHSYLGNFAGRAPEFKDQLLIELGAGELWMNSGLPEDFIGHPVANAWKVFLS